jgi:iron complex outermembrane receptor protein
MKVTSSRPLFTTLMLGCALVAVPAYAQDTAPHPAPDSGTDKVDGTGMKDIVVTAQRRAENVQNVNIAVTALSGDALAERRSCALWICRRPRRG